MSHYRNLGRTGVKVSPLCLGCMNFGGKTDESDAIDIIHRAIDGGINFIDTANVYHRGTSEEIVGKALADDNRREGVVLATKVHGAMSDEDPNMRGNSRRHIMQQCEASLRRLRTDYIDLYQVHRPQPDVPIDETLGALDDLIRQGKVRYIGSSTFAAWQVVEALWVAERHHFNRFVTEQPPYHLLDRRIERELVPMARTFGVGLIPWSPLAGGFLTGKYKRNEVPQEARWQRDSGYGSKHFTDRAFDVIEDLANLASRHECTLSQFALAWCMRQAGVTSPIIGPRTMDQLEDNLGAVDVTITDETGEWIDAIVPPGEFVVPYYDADFGPHPYRL